MWENIIVGITTGVIAGVITGIYSGIVTLKLSLFMENKNKISRVIKTFYFPCSTNGITNITSFKKEDIVFPDVSELRLCVSFLLSDGHQSAAKLVADITQEINTLSSEEISTYTVEKMNFYNTKWQRICREMPPNIGALTGTDYLSSQFKDLYNKLEIAIKKGINNKK